ncbi:hypothetical protein ACJEQF_25275, partial [Klebsiella pneumoniae]|uniref:hypothetical protein n=1 Tax=Klebsiella pneumoniae TaxID=573 RepID=UPI0038715BE2
DHAVISQIIFNKFFVIKIRINASPAHDILPRLVFSLLVPGNYRPFPGLVSNDTFEFIESFCGSAVNVDHDVGAFTVAQSTI